MATRVLTARFSPLPNAIPGDPADNHIFACAVEGHADLIVSGDRDLLRLGEYL
jgi:predicted nucleic acid-binding protein